MRRGYSISMNLYDEIKSIPNITNPAETYGMIEHVTRGLLTDYIKADTFQVVRMSDNSYYSTGWHESDAVDAQGRTWRIQLDPVFGVGYQFTPPEDIKQLPDVITVQGDSGFQTLPDEIKNMAIAYDQTVNSMQLNADRVQAESVADVHVTYTSKTDTNNLSDQIKYIYSHYGYTIRRIRQPYDNATSLYIIQDVRE